MNPELNVLDPTAFARIRDVQAHGEADLLTEMIEAFFDSAPGYAAEMADAQVRGDARRLMGAAHSLKSGAAYLGAHKLERLCQELETRGRSGATTGAEVLIAALLEAVEQTRVALVAELVHQNARP